MYIGEEGGVNGGGGGWPVERRINADGREAKQLKDPAGERE